MRRLSILICLMVFGLIIPSCGDNGPDSNQNDSFDREGLLKNWTDNIILPGFENYALALDELQEALNTFFASRTESDFESLRAAYIDANLSWQLVAPFDIGHAETIGLRNWTNIYPTDTDAVVQNILTSDYNLALPSSYAQQGFPAIDHLLWGLFDSEGGYFAFAQDENYDAYLANVISRLSALNASVLEDWQDSFRDAYIANNGSSATASVDKSVNDMLFHFERFVRAGKVGIPAGVFSGNPLPGNVEGVHSRIYSKQLLQKGFEGIKNVFLGMSLDGINGLGLDDYLQERTTQLDGPDTASEIISKLETAEEKIALLSDDLAIQVETDNLKMLEAYDAMQAVVVLLKVDMMQALNIQVDFVDADGD